MKNIKTFGLLLVFAILLGVGASIMIPQDAQAIMCYRYEFGMRDTGRTCYCNERTGHVIERWSGYWSDGSKCGLWTYCSVCPPKRGQYPYPHMEVPDGEGGR